MYTEGGYGSYRGGAISIQGHGVKIMPILKACALSSLVVISMHGDDDNI